MMVAQLMEVLEKQSVARHILEALQDWFGMSKAREDYIKNSADQMFFCAYDNDKPIGFLSLKQTGKDTVEIYVMGVLTEYHRQGVGRELFEQAKKAAAEKGYFFIQVKTVQMGRYDEYDMTNRFYLSLGFKEFERARLWDKRNPCQIYVMSLK